MTLAHYRRWRRCGPIEARPTEVVSTEMVGPAGVEGCIRWYKADAISGLNDGDLVETWPDSTGNLNGTASGAARPTYKTNIINSLPVVRFNGAHAISHGSTTIGPATWFVVWNRAGTTNNDAIFLSTSSVYSYLQYSGTWYTANGVSAAIAHAAGTFMLKCCVYNGTQHLRFTNGSAEAAQNSTAMFTSLAIGWTGGALRGDVAEVLIYSRALSTADRQAVEDYLNDKYALW